MDLDVLLDIRVDVSACLSLKSVFAAHPSGVLSFASMWSSLKHLCLPPLSRL